MKIGDRFLHVLDDGSTGIEYEICALADLLGFLEKGGVVVPFEDKFRRVVGFARGSEGRAVTLVGFENECHILSPRLREDFSTAEGRARIASEFSR